MLARVNVLKYNFWSEEQIPTTIFILAGEWTARITVS